MMNSIKFEDVRAAAARLAARGEEPTQSRIREELGNRGSFGTIHKHLGRLKEAEGPALPDPVTQAVKGVHAALRSDQEATLDEMRGAADQAIAEAISKQVRAEEDRQRMQVERDDARGELAERNEELQAMRVQLATAQHEATSQRQRVEEMQAELREQASQHAGREERTQGQLATLRADLDQAKQQAREAAQRADRAQQQAADLQGQLNEAQAGAGALRLSLDRAREDLTAEHAAREEMAARLREELAQARGELAERDRQLKAAREEAKARDAKQGADLADTLKAIMERLSSVEKALHERPAAPPAAQPAAPAPEAPNPRQVHVEEYIEKKNGAAPPPAAATPSPALPAVAAKKRPGPPKGYKRPPRTT